jgi:hypothetical protein
MSTDDSGALHSRALLLVAIAVTVAVFTPFARLGIDPHHDGIMLKPALDVLAGETLFRDTFSQYGLGTTYMQAAALWLFGPTPAMRKYGGRLRDRRRISSRRVAAVASAGLRSRLRDLARHRSSTAG